METFCEIILDIENDLSRMNEVSENMPKQTGYAIGQCKAALDRMRILVIESGFPDQKAEIYFFKKIKPADYCKLLNSQAVFGLESKLQKADISLIRMYFRRSLYKINEYIEEHRVKVQYFKCGGKHLDEKHFVRDNSEIPLELRGSHHLMDDVFFTWHDHTFSTIIANEMLINYIRERLLKLENPALSTQTLYKSPLGWTVKTDEMKFFC